MMHLYTEATAIAKEAIEQVGTDLDECQEFIWQSCDSHECAIYYHKAIQFCAEQDTDAGETCLVEICGNLAKPDDTFGSIACRIAFATLCCAAMEALNEQLEEMEYVA